MSDFSTIHVFGYGETQVIGKDVNKKVDSTSVTSLTNFINHVKLFKPADVTLTDHHVIHVFHGDSVRYLGKGTDNKDEKTSFIVKWSEVDSTLVDAIVNEVSSL